ncbi:MAG: hypothetical protein F6K07_04260 [Okeania sp. SIO1H5]|nr:hypothetical protein [Okeania sp. SIO1H5]NET18607.1 hypothetical protein [Okeania sp. SIO1H5]
MYDYLINYDAQREIIVRENEDDIHRESELRDKQIKSCLSCDGKEDK